MSRVVGFVPVIREVMTVEEAARFLRVHPNTLYNMVGRLEVPHRRIGKAIRFSRSALVAWLDSQDTARFAPASPRRTVLRSRGTCGVASKEPK